MKPGSICLCAYVLRTCKKVSACMHHSFLYCSFGIDAVAADSKKNQQVQEASLAFILTPQQVSQIMYSRYV